jgi:hypothetical protein
MALLAFSKQESEISVASMDGSNPNSKQYVSKEYGSSPLEHAVHQILRQLVSKNLNVFDSLKK